MTERGHAPGLPAAEADAPRARRLELLLGLLVAAYLGLLAAHPGLFFDLGITHYGHWFIDTYALLASNDAAARGLDPYAPNPLDYFGRPHVYSHWWLLLRHLGLTRSATPWVGGVLVGAFLLVALRLLRPRTPGQLLWSAAVLGAPPVVLAIERANNDLAIFLLLAPLPACLLSRRRAAWWGGLGLVAVATALKYYPAAAALPLVLEGGPGTFRRRAAAAALVVGAALLSVAGNLASFGRLNPAPDGFLTFGAPLVFNYFGATGAWVAIAGAALGASVAAACFLARWPRVWTSPPAAARDHLRLVVGALLLTACFFSTRNYSYRFIFGLWLAPALWSRLHDAGTPADLRRLARLTAGLLLCVLWLDALACLGLNSGARGVAAPTLLRWAARTLALEQPCFWAFFCCLLAWLVHYVRTRAAALLREPA